MPTRVALLLLNQTFVYAIHVLRLRVDILWRKARVNYMKQNPGISLSGARPDAGFSDLGLQLEQHYDLMFANGSSASGSARLP